MYDKFFISIDIQNSQTLTLYIYYNNKKNNFKLFLINDIMSIELYTKKGIIMSEHYFTENPTSEIKERPINQKILGTELHLTSVSGVFSFEGTIDRASKILIESFQPSGKKVLDLGCGYGAVGLFIKALYKDQTVWLSDINSRAVDYSRLNASKNKLTVIVIKSDLFSGIGALSFDDIVTNPPIAAGKSLNTQLIDEAFNQLFLGGSLWLVAFHNKGGSALKKIMLARFGNAHDVQKSGGIRVYRSVKSF